MGDRTKKRKNPAGWITRMIAEAAANRFKWYVACVWKQ